MGRKFFAFLLSLVISIQFIVFPGNSLSEECRTGFQRGNMARTGCYPDSCAPATDEVSLSWSYQADSSASASTNIAPVALDNMVFLAVNNDDITGNRGHIYAINPQNGTLVWEEKSTDQTDQFTVAGGRLIALRNGGIHSFDYSNGTKMWSYSSTDKEYDQINGSPLVNSGKIYATSSEGYVYCLDFANGKKIWEHASDETIITWHSISDGKIYYGTHDPWVIHCIDQSKGSQIWRSEMDFHFYENTYPIIDQGKIYLIGHDEENGEPYLYCLSTDKCKKIFSFPVEGRELLNPVIVEGKIYLATKDGGIKCLQANNGNMIWEKDYNGAILCSPTSSNGRLFFVAGKSLIVASCADGNILYEEEIGVQSNIDVIPSMGRLFVLTKNARLLSFVSQGKISIDKFAMRFGLLEANKNTSKDIKIKNNGDENIEMTAAKTGPVKLSSEKFTIAPKSNYKLTVTPNLDLVKLGQSNGEIALSWGDSSKKIPFTFCKTAGDSFTYTNNRSNVEGKKYVPANQLPKRTMLKKIWDGNPSIHSNKFWDKSPDAYWNGFFYKFIDTNISVIDPESGKIVLERDLGKKIERFYFDGDKMFLDASYWIFCVDPYTLKVIWSQTKRQDSQSICAKNGKIAIESIRSGSVKGTQNIYIDVFDQSTGKKTYNDKIILKETGPIEYGIAINLNLLYYSANRLYCMNINTGKIIWKTGSFGGDPIIMPEGVISNAAETGKKETFVRCSDPNTGKKLWLFEGKLLCVGNKRVVSEKNGQLSCLDASNGKLLWSKPLNDNTPESVMIMGNSVVMSNGKKMLYYNISNGNLTGFFEVPGIPVCAGGGKIIIGDLINISFQKTYTPYCYRDFDSIEIDTPSLDFGTKLSKLSFELTNYTGKTKNITAEADDGSISFKPDQFSLEPEKKIQIEATIGRVDTTPGTKVVPVKIKWDDGLIGLNAISYKDAGLPSWPNEDGDGGGRTPTSSNLDLNKLTLLWKHGPGNNEESNKDAHIGFKIPTGVLCGDGKLFTYDKITDNEKSSNIIRKIHYLRCFDSSSGKLDWEREFYTENMIWYNGKLYAKIRHTLTCLLGATGETLWSNFVPDNSNFMVYDGLLYSQNGCYDTKDGKKLWETKSNKFAVGDGKYFSYYYDYIKIKKLTCLDARTGKKIWENDPSKLGADDSNMFCTNGILICGNISGIGIDGATGKKLWETSINHAIGYEAPSMFAANGFLVTIGIVPGDVFLNRAGTEDYYDKYQKYPYYNVNIVNAFNGEIIRKLELRISSYPMIARDKIYFLSAMNLFGFNTKSGSFQENSTPNWRFWTPNGFGSGLIACAGDKLFVVKDNGSVYCYSSGDGFLLDENFYDFRTVAPGTKKDIWATIENLSKNQVKTTIEVTTPSVTAETSELAFEPGEKKKLKLTMDLSGNTPPENGKVLRGELVIRWPGPEKRFQLRGYVENKKPEMACTDSFLENEINHLFIYPEACGPKKNLKKVMAWPDAYLTKDKVVALNNGALENYSLDGLKKTIFIKSPECKTLGTPDHEGAFYVADGKQVHKYDEARGKKLWTAGNFKMDPEVKVDKIYYYKGKVFVFVGDLYCLDSKTGKTLWMAQTKRKESKNYNNSDGDLIFQIAFDSNRVYLCRPEGRKNIGDGHPDEGISLILSCLDATNGKLIWEQRFFNPDETNQALYGTSRYMKAGNIFIKNNIVCAQIECHTYYYHWEGLCCFDASSGKKLYSLPLYCDENPLSDGKLRCRDMFIDIETGECIWEDKSYMNCYARSGDYAYANNYSSLDSSFFESSNLEIFNTLTNTRTGSFDFCVDGSSDYKTSYISRRSFVVPIKDYLFVVNKPNSLYCLSEGAAKKLEFQIGSSKFKADGAEQDMGVKLQTIGGVTYLPAKFVAEPMGGDTLWKDEWKQITVTLNGNTIRMRIGYEKATVNAKEIQIDPKNPKVVPIISGGRTLVPMRFLAENLGCKLDYDQKTKKITITSGVK
ncbi:MAG TPA: PQQ-binding-like beta-propeller repeat protein [Caldisericia bacterium]|nr:PQQ-binding-like beta-propeller repeat protein [Caldisericia bacterium]